MNIIEKQIKAAAMEIVYGDLLPKDKFQLPTSAQVAEVIRRNLSSLVTGSPTLPTIHMNGTSPDTLLEDNREVMDAINNATDRIMRMEFNARDYYPVEGSWEKAKAERQFHINNLVAAKAYFEAVAIHCSDAVASRDSQRENRKLGT